MIKQEKKIIGVLRFTPAVFVFFLTLGLYFYISNEYQERFQKEKIIIKEQYLSSEKKRIEGTIEKTIYNYLINKEKSTISNLKKEIQDRVNNAHNIASNIYLKYKDTKSKNEIIDIIKEAIRDIRFLDGRGYFFIYKLNGTNILNAQFPKLEGKNLWEYQDAKGTFLLKKMKTLLKNKNETFSQWYWYKNDKDKKQYKKIGFFKKFEPYDWFIGTGEYLDDFTETKKQEALNHLSKLKYKNGGYIFIIDKNGQIIANKFNELIGINIFDTKLDKLKGDFNTLIKNKKGLYTKYNFSLNPVKDINSTPKISYLKFFDKWDWVIGTGFNINTINPIINKREKELEIQYKKDIKNIFISSIILLVVLLFTSYMISKYIEKIFYKYTNSLKEQKAKLEEAQKIAQMGEWELNIKTKVAIWSNEVLKILKLDSNQKQHGPKLLKELMFKEDWDSFYSSINNCINTGENHFSIYRIKNKKDDQTIWIECRGRLDKKREKILGTIQDITESKQKERLLYQQNRMAAIGEMLGNIAHQWRQPLSIISIKTATLKASAELEEDITKNDIAKYSDDITTQCKHLSQTIDDFRNFFKTDMENVEQIDIENSIAKILNLVKDSFYSNSIQTILNLESCKLKINESTLIQAILNILNNAKDAINANKDEDKYIFIDTYKKEDKLHIIIKDSGGGIDEKIVSKIFEPYFTTKHESIGTGIGLYMTHQIITKHLNGQIDVKTLNYTYNDKKLTGAVFTITIPIT